jgi:hypothetical protein
MGCYTIALPCLGPLVGSAFALSLTVAQSQLRRLSAISHAINGLASGQADNNGQNPFQSVCPFREAVR